MCRDKKAMLKMLLSQLRATFRSESIETEQLASLQGTAQQLISED